MRQDGSDIVTQIDSKEKQAYYWREKNIQNPKLFVTLKEDGMSDFGWSASPFALNTLGDISIKLVHGEESKKVIRVLTLFILNLKRSDLFQES